MNLDAKLLVKINSNKKTQKSNYQNSITKLISVYKKFTKYNYIIYWFVVWKGIIWQLK